jgi:F-type H+-transporting ATPase subunit a
MCVYGVFKGEEMPVISLAAEKIPLPFLDPLVGEHGTLSFLAPLFLVGEHGPEPGIYNTLTATWLTMIILITLSIAYYRSQRKEGSPSRFRVAMELVGDGLYNFVSSVSGEEYASRFLPLIATFFMFIMISNWCGILPGFGSVGVRVAHHAAEASHEEVVVDDHDVDVHDEAAAHDEETDAHGEEAGGHEEQGELIPFFRSANAHLSTTLALATISVFVTHYYGFKIQRIGYARKFINFKASSPKPDPEKIQGLELIIARGARVLETLINGIVGLLEIILELLKVLPFSFRLFGNIFAGEVLLFVISFLFAFTFPMVFLGLELFVGLVQALIFSMLTLVFFTIATTSHHGDEEHH